MPEPWGPAGQQQSLGPEDKRGHSVCLCDRRALRGAPRELLPSVSRWDSYAATQDVTGEPTQDIVSSLGAPFTWALLPEAPVITKTD
jgi:hypothetical protein